MIHKNDTYSVEIEDVNIFANGVCHIDSFVVFVKGAVAGEKCEIKITDVRSKYAYAEIVSLQRRSINRVMVKCKNYEKCGGCSFLHINQKEENAIKHNFVKSIFRKNKIEADFEEICCPVSENYRNKVILFSNECGFGYNEKNSNNVVEHNTCYLNQRLFDEISKFTYEHLKDKTIRALYIRGENELMVCPIFYQKTDIVDYTTLLVNTFPQVKTVLTSYSKEKDFVLEKLTFKTVYGDGYIENNICGLNFFVSPRSFYQINRKCAEMLYEKAIELLSANEDMKIADLFCGTGTMGIIVSKRTGARVFGVEINQDAIKDARYNAKINEVQNITFEAMDASKFEEPVDACIIDPPRKGCSEFMIQTLLRLLPEKIVYVSCNPDTMCRDIRILSQEYKISSPVSVFNMFPKTSHVESVVCLSRK